MRLTPHDARTLLRAVLPSAKAGVTICVRPGRLVDRSVARLLGGDEGVDVVCTDEDVRELEGMGLRNVRAIGGGGEHFLRRAVRDAVSRERQGVVLADTRLDLAMRGITAGVVGAGGVDAERGVEMLPSGVVSVVRPFGDVGLEVWDRDGAAEVQRKKELLGDVCLEIAVRHAERQKEIARALEEAGDDLIRDCVLEASHWGYLVVRRSTLANVFHDPEGGRLVALNALSRMTLHVSGSEDAPALDDAQIARVADDILEVDAATGELTPLPKGRTTTGMVVRPSHGRFARRVMEKSAHARRTADVRRAAPRAGSTPAAPDDLMILTREADNESGGLMSQRLRSNWTAAPLSPESAGGTYWDNRFVISCGPTAALTAGTPPISQREMLLAALKPPAADLRSALSATEFYVRQLRRADWERITATTDRVRSFQVPFQCIRALPAVFQKEAHSTNPGQLVASPHLGLSARKDLSFTAVRLPRYRCLPADIEPGFSISLPNEPRARQPPARPGLKRSIIR